MKKSKLLSKNEFKKNIDPETSACKIIDDLNDQLIRINNTIIHRDYFVDDRDFIKVIYDFHINQTVIDLLQKEAKDNDWDIAIANNDHSRGNVVTLFSEVRLYLTKEKD